MDSIQTSSYMPKNYILKSNLWKFFKALRSQAHPIFCLLVASPIVHAWITIIDKSDSTIQKRVSIAQFVHSLKKMPSTGKYYRLNIYTYHIDSGQRQLFEASQLHELSLEMISQLLPGIIPLLCIEAHNRGECYELTTQIIQHYKFKARYVDEVRAIVEQCNKLLNN